MTIKPTYEELEQKIRLLEERLEKGEQVEESLRDTEKLYHLLFDRSPDGIVIIDPATTRFLDFNETACRQLGYSREEFSQLSIFDLEVEETPEETRSRIEYVIRHGISDFETRQRTKQGQIRNIHITAQYTEVLGKPVYHCIWRDVTELKKAHNELEVRVRERTAELVRLNSALQKEIFERERTEAVLRESEKKYRQFFRTSQDFIFVTSKEGKIIDMNDAALELFGYESFEEVRQLQVPDLYVRPEEREGLYKKVVECGYTKEYPADLRRKDGSIRHTLITAVGQYDENGGLTGLQGTIRDVTEQRQNEEELRKYREKLEVLVAERTKELEDKTKNLEEINVTLNVLLQKRGEDKKILEENLLANISSLVFPYLEQLKKNNLDMQQQFCLNTIEKNLDEIVSPLLKNIEQFNLTPREIQIAYLINDGKTTKEIATVLGIVEGSIATHRKNIRKKLGLDRSSNLQTQLRFLTNS